MKQALACLIGIGFSATAWGFTFPTQVVRPALVDENLRRLYFRELKEWGTVPKKEVSAKIKKKNQEVLAQMKAEPKTTPVSLKLAQEILDSIPNHPVVGEKAIPKYDPELQTGFCFGRAAYVHAELVRRGVPAASIAKIFAVGNLRYLSKQDWDFHVTTVVRGPRQEWYAIDALAKKVIPVKNWMAFTEKNMDRNAQLPTTRFFFTDAVKFDIRYGAYGPENLNLDHFKGYFGDLAKWFEEHPVVQASG